VNLRGQTRRDFPKRVKADAFRRCCDPNGIPHCETCSVELTAGNIIYEHVDPDGLGGEPTLENCKVHCRTCADTKTIERDNPIMQKADRQLKTNFGIRKRSSFACSKSSPWKKKVGGEVVRR
jgi:hypothetical protein